MNSFRFLQQALDAEIPRQVEVLEAGGSDRAGDAALRPRHGHDDAAALQGRGARLPLLPRARPRAADRSTRPGSRSCARTQPELPAARVERFMSAVRPVARRRHACSAGAAALAGVLRGGRGAGGRRQAGGQLDDGRVPRRTSTRPASRPATATSPPSAWPSSLRARRGRHGLDERRQGGLRAA